MNESLGSFVASSLEPLNFGSFKVARVQRERDAVAETQQRTADFWRDNVYECVSYMVFELAKDDKHMDDLLPVLVTYDTEEGYEDEPIEALEHYSVVEQFGDRLREHGEMVIEFMGMTIWGRTCSGQAVWLDEVIIAIKKEN